jgi:hypothetical protein
VGDCIGSHSGGRVKAATPKDNSGARRRGLATRQHRHHAALYCVSMDMIFIEGHPIAIITIVVGGPGFQNRPNESSFRGFSIKLVQFNF